MKHQPGKKGKKRLLQTWSFDQVTKALPYLIDVTRSLRESYLAKQFEKRRLNKISQVLTGLGLTSQGRTYLIQIQQTQFDLDLASSKYESDAQELESMGIFVVSPSNGCVAIPFLQEEQLAWYVLELYHEETICGWRYQSDPIETRRPLLTKQKGIV